MSALRAVLFDLDGVLVRSEEVWLGVLAEAGRRFRGRPVTREEFAPTFGQGTQADVEVFGLRCTPEELDRFYVENFRAHAQGLWIEPTAGEVLQALRGRGLKLAVVTNTVLPLAVEILAAAGLAPYLHALACASEVRHPKPAPDLVRLALSRLGCPAEAAVMVGDSRFDEQAAGAAQVKFIGLGEVGAQRISRLSELAALL
jgi:HAD superfamily hydrolase (TIGR01509 family)